MQINPGGAIAVDQIIGRDQFVAYLALALQAQSVVLVAERRIGKTQTLRKLQSQASANQIIVFWDLEGVHTIDEFVATVFEELAKHQGVRDKLSQLILTFRKGVAGTEIKAFGGGIKLPEVPVKHWKDILQKGVAAILDSLAGKQLVVLWDELPLMLQNIAGTSTQAGATQGNPQFAMELLNVLRALRQTHSEHLRMVYTGSIGLHHVIRDLKTRGYPNAPSNDMLTEEVLPLDMDSAAKLAAGLLRSNDLLPIESETLADVASHIAVQVDGVAYYIHHVVGALNKKMQRVVSKTAIDEILQDAIQSDSQDKWELAHYRDRTQTYYGAHQAHCLALLDAVAGSAHGLSIARTIQTAKVNQSAIDPDKWLGLIDLLQRDFYVIRDKKTSELRFKFKLVLDWWRWHRNITVQTGVGNV
jgi:uncharacterized protein